MTTSRPSTRFRRSSKSSTSINVPGPGLKCPVPCVAAGRAKPPDEAQHFRADSRLLDAEPAELARAQTGVPGELVRRRLAPVFNYPERGPLHWGAVISRRLQRGLNHCDALLA